MSNKKYNIEKDVLKKLYLEDCLSITKISLLIKIPRESILYYLKKYSIPRRTKSEALSGKNNPMFGKTHSEEYKKFVSDFFKMKWQDPIYRQYMTNLSVGENNPMFGKNHSIETKKLISNINKEKCNNLIYKENISNRIKNYWKENSTILLSELAKKRIGIKNHFYGKTHTPETKILISNANKYRFRGSLGSNWQGGKTSLQLTIRSSLIYKNWREQCFKRDDYTCQFCFKKGGNLHVDHIKPFSIILNEYNIKSLNEAENCEQLWEINNGRVLCYDCHKSTDSYAGRVFKMKITI